MAGKTRSSNGPLHKSAGGRRNDPAAAGKSLNEFTRILRLMSNPTRLRLLLALAEQERSVSELCEALQISQPSASHHLGLLRMSGLVRDQRRGKQVFYAIDRALWSDIGRRFFSTDGRRGSDGISSLIGS